MSGLKAAGRLEGVTVETGCVSCAALGRATPAGRDSRFIIVKSGNGGMTACGAPGRKTVVINRLSPGLLEKAVTAVTSGEAWLGTTNSGRESAWSKAVAKTLQRIVIPVKTGTQP